MGKPAARLGDMHVCPMVTGTVPHVGGPIAGPCVPSILIGGQPAAVLGDMAVCTGPPDTLVMGSSGVMFGGKPAARMGDSCAHGGMIVGGLPSVLIGEAGSGGFAGIPLSALSDMSAEVQKTMMQVATMKKAAEDGTPFCEVCEAAGK